MMRRLRKPNNPHHRLSHSNHNRTQQNTFRIHSRESYNYCLNNSNMAESGSNVKPDPIPPLESSSFRLDNDNEQETKLIINSIREVISCCACFTSDSLMKECVNGHLICFNCFLTLRQDDRPQCPTCRTNLYSDSKQALIAQKVLSELPDFCQYCGQKMLHKSLVNHRLNKCVKRRVACALSPFGCDWIGLAEQYREHYDLNCKMRKFFGENSIEDNLNVLLNRFKLIEQSMRETFHCFSTALTHLESNELQTNFINLTQFPNDSLDHNIDIDDNNNNGGGVDGSRIDNMILFRSDHFHLNQSRWTLEIRIKYENPLSSTAVSSTSSNPSVQSNTDPGIGTDQIVISDSDTQTEVDLENNPLRKRRKYDRTDNQPVSVNETNDSYHEKTQSHWNGEISYRLIKESTPNMGRKSFNFTLIQLVVPEVGVIIYAKPQIHFHRFNLRGERTPYYKLNPLRWKHLNNLSELLNYKLVQGQVIIARKLSDENIES